MQLSNTRHGAIADEAGRGVEWLLRSQKAIITLQGDGDRGEQRSEWMDGQCGEPINVSTTITDAVLLLFVDAPSCRRVNYSPGQSIISNHIHTTQHNKPNAHPLPGLQSSKWLNDRVRRWRRWSRRSCCRRKGVAWITTIVLITASARWRFGGFGIGLAISNPL